MNKKFCITFESIEDPEQLKNAQEGIKNDICKLAEERKLSTAEIEPIYDGIFDAKEYLLPTSPRIMWILKEPYDDFDEKGNPKGGGWKLFSDDDFVNTVWKNKTFQVVTYITYGILNHKKWDDMPWIRDKKEMMNVLKRIAYINISKMPGDKRLKCNLSEAYQTWKEIILKQIKVYNPQILIFGNTFHLVKDDLIGEDVEPEIKEEVQNGVYLHVYEIENKKIFDAYHPNQSRIKRQKYVDSIIEKFLPTNK